MNLPELSMVFAILLVVMAFFFEESQDKAVGIEAQQIAHSFNSVHAASERYILDEYPRIAQCFNTPLLLTSWSTDPDGGQSTPFIAVPLYHGDVNSASYTPGSNDFLGRPLAYGLNTSYSGMTGPERCPVGTSTALRSFADVGLLPAGLQSLEYDPSDGSSRRWGNRGLDYRFVIRIINTNSHSGADAAVRLQVQGLIVARNAIGVFMPLDLAGRAAKLSQLPEVGIISSAERTVGTPPVDARLFLTGVGGGWRFQMCRRGTVGNVPAAIVTIWNPVVPTCIGPVFPASGELPISLSATGHQDALTAAIFEVSSGQAAGPTGRTSSDDPPAGRIVALVTHTPHDQLHQVLHSDDVGIPRLNRMRTHLDLGGHGSANTAFLAGTDRDGDGAVDSRLHIIGDTRLLVDSDGDNIVDNDPEDPGPHNPAFPDDDYQPVVIHGMVHITGGLQVGGRQIDQHLREGDVYIAGASVVGGSDDGCLPVPVGTDPSDPAYSCDITVDGATVRRRDTDTALITFPATRGTHANREGGSAHDLSPGDQRVRGVVEMLDKVFLVDGLAVIGPSVTIAPGPVRGLDGGADRAYTRSEILRSLALIPKVGVDVSTAPSTAAATRVDDDETKGRGKAGNLYLSPAESFLATAQHSIVLDPQRGLILQPETPYIGQKVPTSGTPFAVAFHHPTGQYTVIDPDTTFLIGGNRGSAGAGDTDTAFASVRTTAPFGPPTGAFASRVLSASLPDYHVVNWHPSGDGGTGPFDTGYGCPPGMQLVRAGVGPQQHVIPTGWRKDRAPTAIERSSFPSIPIPANPHLGLLNHGHPTQTINVSMPITGTPFTVVGSFQVGFPTHPDPNSHPSQSVSFVNPTVPFDPVIGGRNYIQVQHHDPLLGWRINPQDGSDELDGSAPGYDVFARNAVNPAVLDAPIAIPGHSSFLALYHCTFLQ